MTRLVISTDTDGTLLDHQSCACALVTFFYCRYVVSGQRHQQLKAMTMEDFVRRFHSGSSWSNKSKRLYSRLLTIAWGIVTLGLAFFVGDIAVKV
ncbi:MAG: hypothetical protein ACJAYE_001398 [Candidatus Azotimanducaceae bacterium]|jgi:hypothetical protein